MVTSRGDKRQSDASRIGEDNVRGASRVLKTIARDQIRLGMFVTAIEGSWLSHPFWRSRFLLEDEDDLDALRSANIPGVTIDTSKGLDVADTDGDAAVQAGTVPETALAMAGPDPASAPAGPAPAAPPPATTAPPAGSPARERAVLIGVAPPPLVQPQSDDDLGKRLDRAAVLVRHAGEVMRDLFDQVQDGRAVDARDLDPLVAEIAQSVARDQATMTSMLRLKSKDEYTYMHSVAVSALMVNMARELGLHPDIIREAGVAGLLHDVGKMAVPAAILAKPGSLSSEELKIVRTHPERGHIILRESYNVPEGALDVCLNHHEKIDGTGYPNRVPGNRLSLLARMGAICDVYDAVTSNRPYKTPWTPAYTIRQMASWRGHFDADLFAAFVRSIGLYPLGSLVRLGSGLLAVVKEQHEVLAGRPIVRAFYSVDKRCPVEPQDIDLAAETGNALVRSRDSIVAAEDPADWGFADWERQWPEIVRDR
jgi:putative nucleotidyltransferase with HDIG domain